MAKKPTKRPAAGKNKKATPGKTKKKTANTKKPTAKKKTAPRRSASKDKKRGGFPWSVLLAAILTFIIGIILVVLFGDRLKVSIPDEVRERKPAIVKVVKGTRSVDIFVSNDDGKSLRAIKTKIQKGSPTSEAKAIINKLIKGSGKDSLLDNPMPDGTRLISARISGSKATLDFSKELSENHPGGSSAELQTIYAIVNSITLNINEVKTVRILIDGKGRETLAGHIVISIPLGADKKIISR